MPLIGRPWLDVFCPGWRQSFTNSFGKSLASEKGTQGAAVNHVDQSQRNKINDFVCEIKKEFKTVFEPATDPIKEFKATLNLKHDAKPIFLKATSPPYAVRDEIARQLKDLEQKGIIKYTEHSEWASKLVIAPKKNGKLRLCVNYKTTLNSQLEDNNYPLPVIEDILCNLGGNKYFVSLDLQGAYHQLLLDENSQSLTTVNTQLGLFKYTRLPFGVKTAPATFQRIMEQVLRDLPGVQVYLDDILIGGESLDECYGHLRLVLERLVKYNVKVNLDKCKFFTEELEFLGHVITAGGIGPSKAKLDALLKAPVPTDVSQLRSFLGGVTYLSKFVPMLQSHLHPLHQLLQKDTKYEWTELCQKSFENVKTALRESKLLARYDPNKELLSLLY